MCRYCCMDTCCACQLCVTCCCEKTAGAKEGKTYLSRQSICQAVYKCSFVNKNPGKGSVCLPSYFLTWLEGQEDRRILLPFLCGIRLYGYGCSLQYFFYFRYNCSCYQKLPFTWHFSIFHLPGSN